MFKKILYTLWLLIFSILSLTLFMASMVISWADPYIATSIIWSAIMLAFIYGSVAGTIYKINEVWYS